MASRSPHKYTSRVSRPDDFDEFWREIQDEAAATPLEPELVEVPLRSSEDVEVFEAFYDSIDGVRISAWYCLPRQREGHLATVLVLPGYQMEPPVAKEWARLGYASLSVSTRGKRRSSSQFNPGYPGLLTHGIVDRSTYSYRGVYVDSWRGIDFLLSRPEIDSSRIGVTGSSQGGGLTITTAAMRQEVKAAAASAPFLCGFMDSLTLTDTYPYYEIVEYLRLNPEHASEVERTLAYFDGINFGDRVRCPIIVNIGLQDATCPPETGYTVFGAIGSEDKVLYPYDGHGHDASSHLHGAIIREFFGKHLSPHGVKQG